MGVRRTPMVVLLALVSILAAACQGSPATGPGTRSIGVHLGPLSTPAPSPKATAGPSGGADGKALISGTVYDARSGQVGNVTLSGATVRLWPYGLSATSGPDGRFAFSVTIAACTKLDIEVSASGFGLYRENGVPIYPSEENGVPVYPVDSPDFSIPLDAKPILLTYTAGGAAGQALAGCPYLRT
jgi:hypothetical protein